MVSLPMQYQKQPAFWRFNKPAGKLVFRAAAARAGGTGLQQAPQEAFGRAGRPPACAVQVVRSPRTAVPRLWGMWRSRQRAVQRGLCGPPLGLEQGAALLAPACPCAFTRPLGSGTGGALLPHQFNKPICEKPLGGRGPLSAPRCSGHPVLGLAAGSSSGTQLPAARGSQPASPGSPAATLLPRAVEARRPPPLPCGPFASGTASGGCQPSAARQAPLLPPPPRFRGPPRPRKPLPAAAGGAAAAAWPRDGARTDRRGGWRRCGRSWCWVSAGWARCRSLPRPGGAGPGARPPRRGFAPSGARIGAVGGARAEGAPRPPPPEGVEVARPPPGPRPWWPGPPGFP